MSRPHTHAIRVVAASPLIAVASAAAPRFASKGTRSCSAAAPQRTAQRTYAALVALSANDIPRVDVARMNLLCAACLQAHGRYGEASGAYGIASRANPGSDRLRHLAASPTQRNTP